MKKSILSRLLFLGLVASLAAPSISAAEGESAGNAKVRAERREKRKAMRDQKKAQREQRRAQAVKRAAEKAPAQ
jgi:hypothetical protein